MSIDFSDESAVMEEMHEALDVDELEIDEDDGLTGFRTGTVYRLTLPGGSRRSGKEWMVVEDEDQEYKLAVEIVKQDLEEDPSMFEQSFIEQHINMRRLKDDLESDVLNSNIDRLNDERPDDFWKEYERAGFDAPEEDEDGEREDPSDSEIEELAEAMTKEELRDPMQYLEDIYGREDAVKKAIEIAGIDINAAAEDAVDTDGPGHFLSSYDGETHTTLGGLVYWRTN